MALVKIYTLSDPRNNQIRYVGKTCSYLSKRFSVHIHRSRNKKSKTHKEAWIYSLLKLGLNPVIEEIDRVSYDEWEFWEQWYISLFKFFGFDLTNTTNGGDGFGNGFNHPQFGNPISDEIKSKISKANSGSGNGMYGKKHSKEVTKKISGKLREKYLRGHQGSSKKIIQLDINGKFIKQWDSASSAARGLLANRGNIAACLIGDRKTAGKFKWEYL